MFYRPPPSICLHVTKDKEWILVVVWVNGVAPAGVETSCLDLGAIPGKVGMRWRTWRNFWLAVADIVESLKNETGHAKLSLGNGEEFVAWCTIGRTVLRFLRCVCIASGDLLGDTNFRKLQTMITKKSGTADFQYFAIQMSRVFWLYRIKHLHLKRMIPGSLNFLG